LIVEVKGYMVGMIVDSVADVVDIPIKNIQDTPHFSANIRTDYIKGIGRIDEDLVIVLNVDKILSGEELEKMELAK
ncbi:MAG TPA: chemotaxis protein CheW, partial [Spirochaetota bacterium]|nr:chemotaxis protein CheW [Spirochaetota bacterium]